MSREKDTLDKAYHFFMYHLNSKRYLNYKNRFKINLAALIEKNINLGIGIDFKDYSERNAKIADDLLVAQFSHEFLEIESVKRDAYNKGGGTGGTGVTCLTLSPPPLTILPSLLWDSEKADADNEEKYFLCCLFADINMQEQFPKEIIQTTGYQNICDLLPVQFYEIVDNAIDKYCKRFLYHLYLQGKVDEENFLRMGVPESEEELVELFTYITDEIYTNTESWAYDLLLSWHTLEESARKTNEEYKQTLQTAKKALELLQKDNEAKERRIAELQHTLEEKNNTMQTLQEAQAAAAQKKLNTTERKLTKVQSELDKLTEKYKYALEYIEVVEKERNEFMNSSADKENAADSEIDISINFPEELRAKKIIFIRDNNSSKYVVMKRLAEYFPNSKFINGIAGDIDAATTDAVVMLTRYICHGVYWSVRDTCKRKGITCVHCENSSLSGILKAISDVVKT